MSSQATGAKGRSQLSKIIAGIVALVIVVGVAGAVVWYNRVTANRCANVLQAINVQRGNLDKARTQATDVVNYVAQTMQDPQKSAYLADFVTGEPTIDGAASAGAGEGDALVAKVQKLYQNAQVPAEKPVCDSRDDIDKLIEEASGLYDQAVELSDAAKQLQQETNDRIEAGKLIVQARNDIDAARLARESSVLNAQATIDIAHDEGFVDPAVDELVNKIAAAQALPLAAEVDSSDQAKQAVSQAQEIKKACAELDQLSTDLTRKTNDYTTRKVGLNPIHHG